MFYHVAHKLLERPQGKASASWHVRLQQNVTGLNPQGNKSVMAWREMIAEGTVILKIALLIKYRSASSRRGTPADICPDSIHLRHKLKLPYLNTLPPKPSHRHHRISLKTRCPTQTPEWSESHARAQSMIGTQTSLWSV